jgi:hypothetical protein
MYEVEFYFFEWVINKNSNVSYSYLSSCIKDGIILNNEQKSKVKKVKTQNSMGKTNLIVGTLPFRP